MQMQKAGALIVLHPPLRGGGVPSRAGEAGLDFSPGAPTLAHL